MFRSRGENLHSVYILCFLNIAFFFMQFEDVQKYQRLFSFDWHSVTSLFASRGFSLVAQSRVPAGFSWMNDPRTKSLQRPFTDALAWLHRATGIDLAADANFVLAFRKDAGVLARSGVPVAERRVTHVCRECGEHAVIDGVALPWPRTWNCPWCGKPNPFGRPR